MSASRLVVATLATALSGCIGESQIKGASTATYRHCPNPICEKCVRLRPRACGPIEPRYRGCRLRAPRQELSSVPQTRELQSRPQAMECLLCGNDQFKLFLL